MTMYIWVLLVVLVGHCHAFIPHFASYKRSSVQIGTRSPTPQFGTAVDTAPVAPKDSSIIGVELNDELKSSFMSYAVSTILGRALPDVRDGLKPVHRRVLYAMQVLNLTPDSSYRKCARIVGEVLGKYHPHGDQSVYDALVRMAQDFVMLHPLVAGHGNFGSVDNDPPAAMRYTEAKLSSLAYESLLADIKEDSVGFIPNFDGNEEEPLVLPARLPLLLLNGASGIAVGMATNIPPHNLGELADAIVAMIDNPDLTDQELSEIIPAPDFPTGGLILGHEGSRKMHTTGRGSVVMRAKAHVEAITSSTGAKGSTRTRNAIVITELPYMTNKAALLEKIAELVNDKKLDGIADLRDETDREGMRMVIELKKDAIPAVVQNNLFKKTALQTSFSGNMLALMEDGTQPRRITLKEALAAFIKFRFATVRRRSAHRLSKLQTRDHVVQGMILALGRIDEIIRLMKSSKDSGAARDALMSPLFSFSAEQAEAIMSLTLRRLTALEEGKLRSEHAELTAQIAALQLLMTQDADVYGVMKAETLELRHKHARPRRSEVVQDEAELDDVDLQANDRSVVAITESGYIKRMAIQEFEAQSRGGKGKIGARLSTDKDSVSHFFACNDHDTIIFTTDRGVAYSKRAFQIPLAARTARGVPLPQVLPVGMQETVTSAIPVTTFNTTEQADLVLLTEQGQIKRTPLEAFEKITSRGLVLIQLAAGDKLKWVRTCSEQDEVIIATKAGYACRFPVSQLRSNGRRTRGGRALTLRTGDRIADMDIMSLVPPPATAASTTTDLAPVDSRNESHVLVVTQQGYGKCVPVEDLRKQRRYNKGMILIKFKGLATPGQRTSRRDATEQGATDAVNNIRVCGVEDEVVISTSKGTVIRQRVGDISVQSRRGKGVLLQNIPADDHIISVDIVPPDVQVGVESGATGAAGVNSAGSSHLGGAGTGAAGQRRGGRGGRGGKKKVVVVEEVAAVMHN